jgi:hypothetical protein
MNLKKFDLRMWTGLKLLNVWCSARIQFLFKMGNLLTSTMAVSVSITRS